MNKQPVLQFVFLLAGLFHFSILYSQHTVRIQITDRPAIHSTDTLFLAGNFNGWNPGLSDYAFHKKEDGTYVAEMKGIATGLIEYKITRGSWQQVECAANGAASSNRIAKISSDTTIYIQVELWADDIPGRPPVSTRTKNVFVMDTAFYMPQLNRKRRIWIYLPEDYAFSNRRYPVLYMHDGQNLFDALTSSFGEWGIDEMMDSVRPRKQCIIVGVDHGGTKRLTEYNPYKSRFGDGEGDAYADFLVQTLKPYIDKTFRTKADAANTSIAGSSMGGLISFYTALKYPTVFGSAGVFSPSFWIAPDLYKKVETAATVKPAFYFVCGELEGEEMLNEMRRMQQLVKQKDSKKSAFSIISKGQHNERLWQKAMPKFYEWLINQTK